MSEVGAGSAAAAWKPRTGNPAAMSAEERRMALAVLWERLQGQPDALNWLDWAFCAGAVDGVHLDAALLEVEGYLMRELVAQGADGVVFALSQRGGSIAARLGEKDDGE